MTSEKDLPRYRGKLERRRNQILHIREELDTSWKTLHEPEVEFEERAQKERTGLGEEQLDDLEKAEIEAIDEALRKIHVGSYGICETCGSEISEERLEVLPATKVCASCAAVQEEEEIPADRMVGAARDDFPTEFMGMSDDELRDAIYEHLRNDGRVELEELEIACRDGDVYLEGALPGETSHEILLHILGSTLGLPRIVDNVHMERVLWEREDRMPSGQMDAKTEEQVLLEGEDVDEDVYEAEKEGAQVAPPERFVPEKGEE